MTPRTARIVTWTGSASLLALSLMTLWLNLAMGGEVFAARLIAGLAGCL